MIESAWLSEASEALVRLSSQPPPTVRLVPSDVQTAYYRAALEGIRDGTKRYLGQKTLAWLLQAHRKHPHARFYAKCDTDSFVVVPRALDVLRRLQVPF